MHFEQGCFFLSPPSIITSWEISAISTAGAPSTVCSTFLLLSQMLPCWRKNMHKSLSERLFIICSHSWFCETEASFTDIHPVHDNSVNWPIANMTLDSHLTSPCSMWFISADSTGIFYSSPYWILECIMTEMLQVLPQSNWGSSLLSATVLCLNEAVFGFLCHKEIPKAFMSFGNCPKHYTRGDLTFLMWCDRPAHWTLLKGVNLPLETHSFIGVWQ